MIVAPVSNNGKFSCVPGLSCSFGLDDKKEGMSKTEMDF